MVWGSSVLCLARYRGDLIAAGAFSHAGNVLCNKIARWDGLGWHALGSGLEGGESGARALCVRGDDLIVGGGFATAGGQPSYYWARWGCPAAEWSVSSERAADATGINRSWRLLTNP